MKFIVITCQLCYEFVNVAATAVKNIKTVCVVVLNPIILCTQTSQRSLESCFIRCATTEKLTHLLIAVNF
jgi:hypothetical protein